MRKVTVKKKGKEIVSVSATVEPIDYDKLAEAIVKANNLDDTANKARIQVGFWKAVWLILRGKGSEDGSFASDILATVLTMGFVALFGLGLTVLVVAIWAIIQQGVNMEWDCAHIINNIIVLAFEALICVFLFLITIMFKGAANDLKREKDRNYIVSLFSGMVSFAALIVALVALVKG